MPDEDRTVDDMPPCPECGGTRKVHIRQVSEFGHHMWSEPCGRCTRADDPAIVEWTPRERWYLETLKREYEAGITTP